MNPNFLFVSLPGLSVRTIQDDGEIGEVVEDFLDKVDSEAFSRLRRATGVLPDPHRSRILQKKQNFVNSLLKVVERLAGIETGGSNPNTTVPAPGSITTLEDRHIQNPLTIFGTVKDSILARLILHALFWVGRFWFFLSPPWGALEGVTSIHFARWTICDGGDSLLFESNYDGSWDSYIDNFVDVTGPGLNRIWGNCKGFPRLGTADINSFKECVRAHQHPALVFYSAYPDLTVKNIIANHTLDMAVQAFIRTPDIDRVFAGSYEIND